MEKQVTNETIEGRKNGHWTMCINVDWLQLFTLCDVIEAGPIEVQGRHMDVKLEDGETPLFLRKLSIRTMTGRIWATILQCPRNKVITDRATMIKLENRVLYSNGFVDFAYSLMRALGATYKGITRIDLCCDFNKLSNGQTPQRFIRKFVEGVEGEPGDIVRVGSNKFFLVGTKDNVTRAKYNSIRFGSFKSKIGAYMYDKTLELQEVKDKPWIRKAWEEAGLVSTDSKHVWRAEISISSEGTDVLNMGTGEIFRLSPQFLQYKDSVERLFEIYASRALHFRVCRGQKNRRNYDELNLFSGAHMTSKPYMPSQYKDMGRTEKMCYNKLKALMEEYSDIAGEDARGINAAIRFLLHLSDTKKSIVKLTESTNALKRFGAKKSIRLVQEDYYKALMELQEARRDFTQEDLDGAWQILTIYGESAPMEYTEEIGLPAEC